MRTCRSRSAGCRPASRSWSRSRAGRAPRRRSCSRTASRTYTTTNVDRLLEHGGAVPVGQTTASEFGGLNVSVTKLNGVTHNPWRHGRTVGGSSSGSAAAVVGWARDAGDRRRRWRIDPHPRGLHRAARHEGHVRAHPAQPERLHAPEHRRARQPGSLGARRGPLLRRVRRLRPGRPVEPAEASRASKPVSARTTSRASGSRSSRHLGGVPLDPGVESAAPRRSRGVDRVDRDGAGRPRHRASRTSPRSG